MNGRRSALLLALVVTVAVTGPLLAADEPSGEKEASLIDPNVAAMIWTWIAFLSVLFVLWKTAWGPLLRALDKRETRIQESLHAAERAAEESKRLAQEHEKVMAEARRQATAAVEEGKRDAQVVKEKIIADARRDAEEMARKAKAEISRAKDVAVHEIHERSVQLAVDISERLIRKSLSESDHENLLKEAIDRYEKMS